MVRVPLNRRWATVLVAFLFVTLLPAVSTSAPTAHAAPRCSNASGYWDATPREAAPGEDIYLYGDGTQDNGGWYEGLVVSFGLYDANDTWFPLGQGTVACDANGAPWLGIFVTIPATAAPGPAWIQSTHAGIETCCMPFEVLRPTPTPAPTPPPPTDTSEPGGMWIRPEHNFIVTNNQLQLSAHAYDNEGGSGVKDVRFTAYYSGSWHTICTVHAPDRGTGDEYTCLWEDMSDVPAGPLTVNFDVYDKAGNYNLAPHGSRHGEVRRQTTSPPPSSAGLLAPVAAGVTVKVIHGYNDPLSTEDCPGPGYGQLDHCKNQRYGLDFEVQRPTATPKAGCQWHPETNHNICGGFLTYWKEFGGLGIFGYPLTEEFQQNGLTMQYFERARLEWHPGKWPERYDVLQGLLGSELTAHRSAQLVFNPAQKLASSNCTYFEETGHNLCGGFRAYVQQFGGVPVYGFPISEEFREVNPDTGKEYTVQYFERQRLEWHPGEWAERYDVMLGRLGAQSDTEIVAPATGTVLFIDGDTLGLRLDNGNVNLSIAHFSTFNVARGDRVERGQVLGKLFGHIHLSIDDRYNNRDQIAGCTQSSPGARNCSPIPFTGSYTIEGKAFDPGSAAQRDVHNGQMLVSSNVRKP